jgi:hypothetical protein
MHKAEPYATTDPPLAPALSLNINVPGVYISYPFCAQKCTYRNFASGVFPREITAPGGAGKSRPAWMMPCFRVTRFFSRL